MTRAGTTLRAALAATLLAFACLAAPARAEVRRLVVVHTNDLHGQLYPGPDYLTPGEPKPRMGGIAAIAALVERERAKAAAEGAGFLLLDAGDIFHGSPEGDATKGKAVVACMNLLGYDAVCVGNHEFAYGVQSLLELKKAAKFPFLANNIYYPLDESGPPPHDLMPGPVFDCFVLKNTGGLRVVVIGATTDATPKMNRPADVKGVVFRSHADYLRREIAESRRDDKPDIVIALTHIGSQEDLALAQSLTGCALIVGGHDHVALDPAVLVGETLVVQAGEQGRRVGRVTLDYDTEKHAVVRRESVLFNLFADAPRSATVEAFAESLRRRDLDVPIGEAASEIRRGFSGESPAGGLACEAVRDALGADVAIFNQTTVRGGFARGPVTKRDCYACAPFQNDLCAVTLTGEALASILDGALSRAEPNIETAGLVVRFDPRKPRGERIVEALVNGEKLSPEKRYRLATTDFYLERIREAEGLPRESPPERMTPYDVLCRTFAKRSPVRPSLDRRLISLAPPEAPRGRDASGSRPPRAAREPAPAEGAR